MKRKVVQQGPATLMVSLPSKWAKEQGIVKGDEVELTENKNELIISHGHIRKIRETVKADITNLDRTSVLLLIQSLYRYGYDTIELTTENKLTYHHRKKQKVSVQSVIYPGVSRLIGAELISSSEKTFIIKYITQDSEKDFELILRRIFRLMNEMFESLINLISSLDKTHYENIELQHINIKKFINYCLRLLNKYGYPDVRKTCFYFTTIQYLSKIEDFIKNSGRFSKKNINPNSSELINAIKKISAHFSLFYELFYSYDIEKCHKIIEDRETIKQKVHKSLDKLTKPESFLIGSQMQILEIILDLYELRISLEQ